MDRRLPRRMLLATGTVSAGAILLGARGGGAFAATSQGTPVTGATQEVTPVVAQTNKALWLPWLELWNGNLSVADTIVAPNFVAHFAPIGGGPAEVRGPDGLKGWIGGILAPFTDHRFTTAVGPIADGDLVTGRWVFRATYQGGIPGSSPDAVGKPVEYAGIDILRVEDGSLAEYWLCADTIDLLQQVGVIPS